MEGQKEKEEASSETRRQYSDSEGGRISTVEEIMSLMYEEHDGRLVLLLRRGSL
jgi:hypothetical protein